jgi:SAM-dependent methyltransferase
MRTSITPPSSVTYQHIAAVINTELDRFPSTAPVRILDLGCGTGELLAHILKALAALRPGLQIEAFGLDVSDAGQQEAGYFAATKRDLARRFPALNWDDRLTLVTTRDQWPYSDGSFDFITSNHVMEHVSDHDLVFGEINRCLRVRGMSVNLFPLREVLWEAHACMPLVHRVRRVDFRARLMLLFARMGFRRHYHREMRRRGWTSLDEFARIFARVLETDTNYLTAKEIAAIARRNELRISFAYTKDFFIAKALSYLNWRPYRYRHLGSLETIGFSLGKRVSSVTVLLRKG